MTTASPARRSAPGVRAPRCGRPQRWYRRPHRLTAWRAVRSRIARTPRRLRPESRRGSRAAARGARRPRESSGGGFAVMDRRLSAKLRGLLLRRRIAQEVAAPDLRPGEIFDRSRSPQRRQEADVEVEIVVRPAVGRCLMERHDIREGLPPEVVVANRYVLERLRERLALGVGERRDVRHATCRRDIHLVGVTREVGHEGDRMLVLVEQAAAVTPLGTDDIGEQRASGLTRVATLRLELRVERLPCEVRGVDLAVWVRVRHADHFALVLEDENLLDLRSRGEIARLLAPGLHDTA